MSSPSALSAVLLLFFASFLCLMPSSVSPYPFSTLAISRPISHLAEAGEAVDVVICALVLPPLSSLAHRSELNCTSIATGLQETYKARNVPYSAIAAGDGFLCGITIPADIRYNATMRWWGFGGGEGSGEEEEEKGRRVYFGPGLAALASGDTHVCALIGRRRMPKCWRWEGLKIPSCYRFSEIAVGRDFVCGLLHDGRIKCFGDDRAVVGREPEGNFTMLAAGTRHACGVSVTGELCCWGVGGPKEPDSRLSSVASIALGENTTCVLQSNGTVRCFGGNSRPPDHLTDAEFVAIEARGDTICGILLFNFSVVCWGNARLQGSKTVYNHVLPGSCEPTSVCRCGFLPDSGHMCPNGEGICQSCKLQFSSALPSNNSPPKNKGKRKLLQVTGSAVLGFGLLALVCVVVFLVRKKKERAGSRPANEREITEQRAEFASSSRMSSVVVEEFPLRLLAKLTDDFSEEHKIGSGSFGVVYCAALPDGREVAIKRAHLASPAATSSRLDQQQRRRDKELLRAFSSELALLSRVNHRNLVRLLGFCQERGERVLIYEYMANGTLHDHLHKRPMFPSSPLGSWSSRLRIALDAARGIEYLHSYAVPAIIHRDIKSSNILLDAEWTAKVADFGLSLTGPDEETSPAAGTVGYMDPEYYRLRRLTAKSDVYSFGVVLLELVTGHKAIYKIHEEDEDAGDDDGSSTPMNVVEMAVPLIEADDVVRVMDRRVADATPEEKEAVAYVGYVAAECVRGEARLRPTMGEVVGALERAVIACSSGGVGDADGGGRDTPIGGNSYRSVSFLNRACSFLDRAGSFGGSLARPGPPGGGGR